MEMITTKEYAQLRGCSETYVNRLVRNGKVSAIPCTTDTNTKKNMIPLDQLRIEEQRKYYESRGVLQTEVQVQNANCLEHMNTEEREECVFWERIVKEWQSARNNPDVKSKTEFDEKYVIVLELQYPNIKFSTSILYRKLNYLKDGNLQGLIDKRGKAKKGYSKIDKFVWQVYLSFLLDPAKHPLKKCYDYTKLYVQEEKPELLEDIPAYCTFTRHVKADVPDAVMTLGRDGDKAFDDRCAPYIKRVYDDMESNDYWIGDNHTIDVIVGENGKTFRLYLTGFMDARSGIFTGIYLTDSPNSQASIYSLRRGIKKYGIPRNVYLDNGREFLTRDFGGLGHRKKKKDKDKFTPPPILERLGINMVNALVRNAKAKTIERRFLDFKNGISRLFSTYTGGNVVEKPEILKIELKKGNIPDKETFIQQIETLIEYSLNYEEYNGSVVADKGMRKIDVYHKNLHTKITATDEQLHLMMMRSTQPQKVKRRGVTLKINEMEIDYFNNTLVQQMSGKQVYFRYDPDDLSKVRIYDLEDRFIMEVEADNAAVLKYGASTEEVKAAMAKTRSAKKVVKEVLENSVLASIDRDTAFNLSLSNAYRNKDTAVLEANIELKALKVEDEKALLYKVQNIDLDKMNENAIKRQGGGEEDV